MKKPQTFDCRKIPLRRLEVNPYEPVAQPEKQAFSVRQMVLVVSLGALYTLTGLLVLMLAYLPIRYPGLSDKESGPAYYWPDDLFYLLLPGTSVLLVASMLVFLTKPFTEAPQIQTESGIDGNLIIVVAVKLRGLYLEEKTSYRKMFALIAMPSVSVHQHQWVDWRRGVESRCRFW
jgi:hypothetical protein